MIFDYFKKLFGRERKRKTRYSDLETKAKEIIASYVNGTIGDKEFARAFHEIGITFRELSQTNGETTIDQDTPLWLNSLLGLHFVDWLNYQKIKWYFEAHPEEFTEERKIQFSQMQMLSYDERFRDACENVLKALK